MYGMRLKMMRGMKTIADRSGNRDLIQRVQTEEKYWALGPLRRFNRNGTDSSSLNTKLLRKRRPTWIFHKPAPRIAAPNVLAQYVCLFLSMHVCAYVYVSRHIK